MNKRDVYRLCNDKAEALINDYYPDFVHDAAVVRPEQVSPEYNDELPYKVESEFKEWLDTLWKQMYPDSSRPIDSVMNRHLNMTMTDADYTPQLRSAKAEADKITLWEKITKTNHKDVTVYKGLLLEYTRQLLVNMIDDFLEDIPEN